jgi:hypothetical protein
LLRVPRGSGEIHSPMSKERAWWRRIASSGLGVLGRFRGWNPSVRAWTIVALILASTHVLVFAQGVTPREWVTAVTFVAAHLMAAEAIEANHRRR